MALSIGNFIGHFIIVPRGGKGETLWSVVLNVCLDGEELEHLSERQDMGHSFKGRRRSLGVDVEMVRIS